MRKVMSLLGAFLGVLVLVSTLLAGRANRHEDNPINRNVGTVGPNDYYYPDLKTRERVFLSGLSMERNGGVRDPLGWARCIARYVATNSPNDPKKMNEWLNPRWIQSNGAQLYQTYVFHLEKPLAGGNVFNNNPDGNVDKHPWSWIRVDSITNVTICYTSRGMVATPGMPTKNMKPLAPDGSLAKVY